MNSLVEFWKECDLAGPLYIHPHDKSVASKYPKYFDPQVFTWETFLESERFGDFKDNRFHLSMLPVPYMGNLSTADIFVLARGASLGLSTRGGQAIMSQLMKPLTARGAD